MSRREELVVGIRDALPIVFGYLPIGVAYGILAAQTGLSDIVTVSMSVFVFAGSSQLITVNMLGGGAGVLPIIMMTFLVNLRHLLMSASMSLHFKEADNRLLPVLSYIITDESFAVSSANLPKREKKEIYFLGLGITAYLAWVISSWLGASLGSFLPSSGSLGLDFVLPAMFIVLLVLQIKDSLDILVAILAGLFSLLFVYILPENWNIIMATVVAATLGVLLERWS